jgi:hypothetical protein
LHFGDELGVFVGLTIMPVTPNPRECQGRQACSLVSCFNGPEAEGRAAMASLLATLPEPWFDWRSVLQFTGMQTMFDALLPSGLQRYWRGDLVHDLPDEAIDAHLALARRLPHAAQSLMHIYPVSGVVHRVDSDATAWRARDAMWTMVIAGIDADLAWAEAVTMWAKDYWPTDGGYMNFMMGDGDTSRLRATYGDNYARLVEVKTAYDPDNVFSSTQNIPPAQASSV